MFNTIDILDLDTVTGGTGLLGDNHQTIAPVTNWGGTLTINNNTIQTAPKSPTSVVEYRKLHPELRIGSPRPIHGYGPMLGLPR